MIFVALGANEPSAVGPPRATLEAALVQIAREGGIIKAQSRFYASAPVPASDQPWFVNAVVAIDTLLDPEELLALLHRIEARFGRVRRERNAARPLDLDLLAYHDLVRDTAPLLPHPRMHERAFVLLPLAEIAPTWRHPLLKATARELAAGLPADQGAKPLPA